MDRIGVETTQHVQLQYNLAGVGDRINAFLIDALIIAAYYIVIILAFNYVEANGLFSLGERKTIAVMLVLVIPVFLYHLIFELLWEGKSIGKWAVGIRVVKVDGSTPGLGSYLIRWVFRIIEISSTSGVLAYLVILLNGKGQRLGDIAAGTCVIKTRNKMKLEETIYAATAENYEPMYPQVKLLTDTDIRIIKEVLDSKKNYEYNLWFVNVERTANIMRQRLNVSGNGLRAEEFLLRIITDYNYLFKG